jgi:hypothetical protein
MNNKPDIEMLAKGRVEALKAIYTADDKWVAEKAIAMRNALEPLSDNNEILCDIVAGLDEIAAQCSDKRRTEIANLMFREDR